jgi:hypothetical protein
MPRWKLRRDGVVLGVIEQTERDMWNVHGTFTPAASFDPALENVFAKKADLATRLEDDDSDSLTVEFDDLEQRTSPPHFELVAEDGRVQAFGLLYVSTTDAGFRLL